MKHLRAFLLACTHECGSTNQGDTRRWCRTRFDRRFLWRRGESPHPLNRRRRTRNPSSSGTESECAQLPVNQRIVVVEPIESKNHRTRRIKLCYKETERSNISGRKSDWQLHSLSDGAVRSAVEKTKSNGRNRRRIEISMCKIGVDEGMGRTQINKGLDWRNGIGKSRRSDINV